jgi:hypothetical protein
MDLGRLPGVLLELDDEAALRVTAAALLLGGEDLLYELRFHFQGSFLRSECPSEDKIKIIDMNAIGDR